MAYKIFNHPITNYNKIRYSILKYSDLVFQDILLILNTTNSIFDAIYYISSANYPYLSNIFKEMIFQINFYGKSPEILLDDFINQLPNGNLKERLISLMATKFNRNKLLEQLETLSGDKKSEYETVTKQLESKLIIMVGICLFFPILTSLFISFIGKFANLLSPLMFLLFILLNHKLRNQLLKTHFELFGDFSLEEKGKNSSSNSTISEFIHFLSYFANKLKHGLPQETALLEAYRSYNGPLKYSLENCIRQIYQLNNSIKIAWKSLKKSMNHPQIHFLINLIDRMLEKSSIETGNRILSILQQLKANQEMIQERETIIKAQQFKIKFLAFIMASILGLLTGIIPLLFQIADLLSNPQSPITLNLIESLPLSLSIFGMTIYSAYFLCRIVKISNPWRYALYAGLNFLFIWYLTGLLL